jgi:hypothetical protein
MLYIFSRIRIRNCMVPYCPKILKILTLMTLTRKTKQCKLTMLWIKVWKNSHFLTCVKLEVGSGSVKASKMEGGSRLSSRRCRSTRITGFYPMKNGLEYEPPEWQRLSDHIRYYESNWRFTPCASSSKNNVSPPTNSRSKWFSSSNLC